MGIGFISFWITNFALLINSLDLFESNHVGLVSLGFIIGLTLFSFVNARNIKIKKIQITSNKINQEVKLIFLSDMHLGTNSGKYLENICIKMKELNFEFLLIGGDLIDSSKFKLDNLKILKKLKKPIFFVSGNHEYYLEDYKKKLRNLKNYGLLFLDNRSYRFSDINIIGISDNQKIVDQKTVADKLLKKEFFNIIVVHQPTLWNFVFKKTDLMLSGHTHNGQIFPFNFLVKLRFKNIYGLYEKLHSKLYVSSGCGCWGPKMRLGSKNEIIQFSIYKQKDKNN